MKDGQNPNEQNPETEELKPKYIAQKCPVCNGFGTLKYGAKTCQGCEGKGYVLVPTFEVMDGQKDGKNNKEQTIE